MSILDILRPKKTPPTFSRWQELGTYQAIFSMFGNDIYKSELVRSCVRPLAIHTSKAAVHSSDKKIEYLLNSRPNMYMNGADFLQKVRNYYEIANTCFILIDRGPTGKPIGFYPVPYSSYEALEYNDELYIKFFFADGETMTVGWPDLAVMRKDYNSSDIAGDTNTAIIKELDLINTANQGNANAIKATANLRGILKTTKGMLAPELIKKQKDDFVKDYLNLENKGGIAALDATQEFVPVTMNPVTTNAAQMKEMREEIQRYFGVSDEILMNKMDAEQLESFYESKIAPFLNALSIELTSKSFVQRDLLNGAYITFDCNKLQFASLDKKIQLFSTVVLYGGMTINEWRALSGMDPIDGGDDPIRRLDASTVDEAPKDEDKGENEDGN